eukprot:COSAG01_NODE_18570_length_1067_cov_0.923554_1_plen_104_part_00
MYLCNVCSYQEILRAQRTRVGAGAAASWVIPAAEVEVEAGAGGLIGRGALGEVRRGTYRGVAIALKGLHLLRTDAAAVSRRPFRFHLGIGPCWLGFTYVTGLF